MRIERSRDPHPVAAALVAGAAELGFPTLEDPNGGDNLGAGLANMNITGGRRHSVVDGYLAGRGAVGRTAPAERDPARPHPPTSRS